MAVQLPIDNLVTNEAVSLSSEVFRYFQLQIGPLKTPLGFDSGNSLCAEALMYDISAFTSIEEGSTLLIKFYNQCRFAKGGNPYYRFRWQPLY